MRKAKKRDRVQSLLTDKQWLQRERELKNSKRYATNKKFAFINYSKDSDINRGFDVTFKP